MDQRTEILSLTSNPSLLRASCTSRMNSRARPSRTPAGGGVVEQALRLPERAQPQRWRRGDVFDAALIAPCAVGAELAEQAEAGRAVLIAAALRRVGQACVDEAQDRG